MNTIASITLDAELAEFVQKKLDDGRYGSASDVIEEGEASGEPQPFDFDEFIAQKRLRRSKV